MKRCRGALMLSVFSLSLYLGQGICLPETALAQDMFNVTKEWEVRAPAIETPPMGDVTPCLLVNQYENGFEISFTGGQNVVPVMLVDFKQPVFQDGNNYASHVAFDSTQTAMNAQAVSTSALLFKFDNSAAVYDALANDTAMMVDVEGNPLSFSIQSASEALNNLNECVLYPENYGKPLQLVRTHSEGDDNMKVASSVNQMKQKEVYIKRQQKPQNASPTLIDPPSEPLSKQGEVQDFPPFVRLSLMPERSAAAMQDDASLPQGVPDETGSLIASRETADAPYEPIMMRGETMQRTMQMQSDAGQTTMAPLPLVQVKEMDAKPLITEAGSGGPSMDGNGDMKLPSMVKKPPLPTLPGAPSMASLKDNDEKEMTQAVIEPADIKGIFLESGNTNKPDNSALPDLSDHVRASPAPFANKPADSAAKERELAVLYNLLKQAGVQHSKTKALIDEEKPAQATSVKPNWDAKSGENVKDVLARWSNQAERKFVWDADLQNKLTLEDDISLDGDFEVAVTKLLQKQGMEEAVNAAFVGGNMSAAEQNNAQQNVADKLPQKQKEGYKISRKNSLRQNIEEIARAENMKLFWNADRDFIMVDDIQAHGTPEFLLSALLDQYQGQSVRPVGQLNTDPATGQKFLVIDTQRSL